MTTLAKLRPAMGLSNGGKLRLICRALEIGDSWMTERNLNDWSSHLERDPDPALREGIRSARVGFAALKAFEEVRGRFSRLDREAQEIVWYENEMRRSGGTSVYGLPNLESDCPVNLRAVSIAAS